MSVPIWIFLCGSVGVLVALVVTGWLVHARGFRARWRLLYWIIVVLAVVVLFNLFQSSN
jgi:hypothetical protein